MTPTKGSPMKKHAPAIVLSVAYLLSIVAAVWAVDHFGIVHFGPFAAPAAVFVVGITLVLRDLLSEHVGPWVMIGLIVAGAALSALVNPHLAIASGLAFLTAETLDWLIYSKVRDRHSVITGVLASNAISIPVDSIIFLTLAFGSLAFLPGQIVGKAIATLLAVAVIAGIRRGR